MRLYVLPISTRRTLLYCHKLDVTTTGIKESLPERIQTKAAKTWASWEAKDKGWQKTVVDYGNKALRRIPYEEWGLKSVPPLSERLKREETKAAAGTGKVEVVYPQSLIPADRIHGVLKTLATEREALHKRRLIWCVVGMPISAPVALIPVIPNIPFFYLVYRAWSHWKAISGGKHIQFLLKNKLLEPQPSFIVDDVYANQKPPLPSTPQPTTDPKQDVSENITPFPPPAIEPPYPNGETMLLSQENAKRMTKILELPQLEVELERAIWQVETAIKKSKDESKLKEEGRKERAEEMASAEKEIEDVKAKVEEVEKQADEKKVR